jgi:hypothetical protein
MTFDNSKTIIGLRIKLFAATLVLLGYIGLAYAAKLIKFPVLGMSDAQWTIIVVVIWLVICTLPMVLNYQYISFSDEEESIVFRYFNAGIVGGRKNSVEINKAVFAGYSIENKLLGLSKSLVLFQKVGQGTAKYPPIHITALSAEQRTKLIKSLNSWLPKA